MSIFGSAVTGPASDAPASWIAPRLGEFGTVGGLVPEGFARCVLIRPAVLADGGHDVVGGLSTTASIVGRHTDTPETVWFAIWEGYGWTSTTALVWSGSAGRLASLIRPWRQRRVRSADRRRARVIRRGLERLPTFGLPHRRYFLLGGRLEAVTTIHEPGSVRPQAPDLWWPEDRRWFVATDTDLDWTYVAGSADLIDELIGACDPRALVVTRDDRNDRFG